MNASKLPIVILLLILVAIGIGIVLFLSLRVMNVEFTIQTEDLQGGTTVLLDSEELGRTNQTGKLIESKRLKKDQKYILTFQNSEFDIVPQEVMVVADSRSKAVTIRLVAKYVDLEVGTNPATPDAQIAIDDSVRGTTGLDGWWRQRILRRQGESIKVQVTDPSGRRSWDHTSEISGPAVRVVAQLPSSAIVLAFTTAYEIGGSEILLDGVPKGRTDEGGVTTVSLPVARERQRFTVSFRHTAAAAEDWIVTIADGDSPPARLTHQIRLTPLAPVSVKFNAKADGRPIAGIRFKAGNRELGITDNSGMLTAILENVLVGESLQVKAEAPQDFALSSLSPETIRIAAGIETYTVAASFEVAKYVAVTAQVEDGTALSGVTVTRDGHQAGLTSQDGSFVDRIPRLGQAYSYLFQKSGYVPHEERITPGDVRTSLKVEMELSEFSVSVRDSIRGVPVANVGVFVEGQDSPLGRTDAEGKTTIQGWGELGDYRFQLRQMGERRYENHAIEVTLRSNHQEVPVRMTPLPAQLELTFHIGNNGGPLGNARVVMTHGISEEGRTGENGRVTFTSYNLSPGNVYGGEVQYGGFTKQFEVEQEDFLTNLTVEVPMVADVTLTANEAGSELRIYDQGGTILTQGNTQISAQLPAGQYRVWGSPPGSGIATYDQPHFFNQTVVRTTIPVVTWYSKGVRAEERGDQEKAFSYFGLLEVGEPHYADAQTRRGQIYLVKRNNAELQEEKNRYGGGAADAFDNAHEAGGSLQANPNFAYRVMTLNYELEMFPKALIWFKRLEPYIHQMDPDPQKQKEKFVSAYYYRASAEHKLYEQEAVKQGNKDLNRLNNLKDRWTRFRRIAKSRGLIEEYNTRIETARGQIAVWY